MTRPDLAALEALLAKATPGPWRPDGDAMNIGAGGRATFASPASAPPVAELSVVGGCGCCGSPYGNGDFAEHDRALIVALRNAAPALLAYVRELEQRQREGS